MARTIPGRSRAASSGEAHEPHGSADAYGPTSGSAHASRAERMTEPTVVGGPIVLFDGVCNLCNAAVRFIIDRDPMAAMRFASLQSEVGQALIARHAAQLDAGSLPSPDAGAPPTLLLVEDGRIYARSTAALRIARRLNGPWPVFAAFLAVPRFVRDPVYDFVANRRYRWFGKTDACRLPTKEEAGRFLG